MWISHQEEAWKWVIFLASSEAQKIVGGCCQRSEAIYNLDPSLIIGVLRAFSQVWIAAKVVVSYSSVGRGFGKTSPQS